MRFAFEFIERVEKVPGQPDKLMKTILTILGSILCFGAVTALAADDERFRPGEWDLSPFCTYVDKSGDHWGVGASLTYFITDKLGIGATTYWTEFKGSVFDNAAGEAYQRLRVLKSLSTYAVGSVGYQFEGDEWFQTVGAGLDFRPFDMVAARRVFVFLVKPVMALIVFNAVLLFVHWPAVVEASVSSELAHFSLHVLVVGSGIVMWWPVVSPLPEMPPISPPAQMLYLFFQSLAPTIPASFLTFGHQPLYGIYATFPRIWGISALSVTRCWQG